jgi:hypothetical protein
LAPMPGLRRGIGSILGILIFYLRLLLG